MDDERVLRRIAGIAAILAGVVWIGWAVLNATVSELRHPGPDPPGSRLARLGDLLIASWNLLLIPAALALWRWLQPRRPNLMLLYTVCGIASLLFWALGSATRGITPTLEASYLFLSGVWWLGTGLVLRSEKKALGGFTTVLGMFSLLDAAVTFMEPVPLLLLAVAGLKIPLSTVWDFWIGVRLCKGAPLHTGEA